MQQVIRLTHHTKANVELSHAEQGWLERRAV